MILFIILQSSLAGSPKQVRPCEFKQIYVNNVSGSDSNDGSESKPLSSVSKAMAVLKTTAGCVEILVKAANPYDEGIFVSRGGSSISDQVTIKGIGNPVFISNNPMKTLPLADGRNIELPTPRQCIQIKDADWVTVSGITCDGRDDWPLTGFSQYAQIYNSSNVALEANEFKGALAGFRPSQTDNISLVLGYKPNNAIAVYGNSKRVLIKGNKVVYPNPPLKQYDAKVSDGSIKKAGSPQSGTMNEGIAVSSGSDDTVILQNELVGPCYKENYGTAPHTLIEIKANHVAVVGNTLSEKTHRVIGVDGSRVLIDSNAIHSNAACTLHDPPQSLQIGFSDGVIVRRNAFYSARGGAIGLPRGTAPESPDTQSRNRFYNNDFHHNLAQPKDGGLFVFSFSECKAGQAKPSCGGQEDNKIFNNLYYLNGTGDPKDVALKVRLGSDSDGKTILGMHSLSFVNNIILNDSQYGIPRPQLEVYDLKDGKTGYHSFTIHEAQIRYPTNVHKNIEYYYTDELRELLTKDRGMELTKVIKVIDAKTIEVQDPNVFWDGIQGIISGDTIMNHKNGKSATIVSVAGNKITLTDSLEAAIGDSISLPFVNKPDIGANEK